MVWVGGKKKVAKATKAPRTRARRNPSTTYPKGAFYGRRASDSAVVRISRSKALQWAAKGPIPASRAPQSASQFLAIFWVPEPYKGEAAWRVRAGWIHPIWVWERGSTGLKGLR